MNRTSANFSVGCDIDNDTRAYTHTEYYINGTKVKFDDLKDYTIDCPIINKTVLAALSRSLKNTNE